MPRNRLALLAILLCACGGGSGKPPQTPLLPGDPAAPALSALADVKPVRAEAADIDGPVLLSRLTLVVSRSATVAQVNAALDLAGASGIAWSKKDAPFLTAAVPRQRDAAAIDDLAAKLRGQPGIRLALPGRALEGNVVPGSEDLEELNHLLVTRFTAAWNAHAPAEKDCATRKVTVVVPDDYFGGAPAGFTDQVPGALDNLATAPLVPLDADAAVLHGYEVLSALAAKLDDSLPTGANPFPSCLRIVPVDLSGLDFFQSIDVIAQTLEQQEGKVVVSISQAFKNTLCGAARNGPCAAGDVGADLATRVKDQLALRISCATLWARFAMQPGVVEDSLIVQAASNDRESTAKDGALGALYPGLHDARLASPFALAAQLGDLAAVFSDASRWTDPADPSLPSLVLDPGVVAQLQQDVQALVADPITSANLTLVGSVSNAPAVDALQRSAFSDDNADLHAVGQDVTVAGGHIEDGTSFAAPQVAGLASYLWLLDDNLRQQPVAQTLRLLRETAQPSATIPGLLDAYAAVLSLDRRENSRAVRLALLDLNGDGNFDHLDLQLWRDGLRLAEGSFIPDHADYSRFDLNGDGLTGGIPIGAFDLDQSGALTGTVSETIEDYPVDMNKAALSDLQILCFYAYSDLYAQAPANHDEAVAERSNFLGPDNCVRARLSASLAPRLQGPTSLTITATTGGTPGTPAPDMLLQLTGNCASLSPSSGRTDRNGQLTTTVTPVSNCGQISVTAKASGGAGTPVLATQVFTSSAATIVGEWDLFVSSEGFLTVGSDTVTLDDRSLDSDDSHPDPTGSLELEEHGTITLPSGDPYTFSLHAGGTAPTSTLDSGTMAVSASCGQSGSTRGSELDTSASASVDFGSQTTGFTVTVSMTAQGTEGASSGSTNFRARAEVLSFVGGVEQPSLRADLSTSPSLNLPFTGHFDAGAFINVSLSTGAGCQVDGAAAVIGTLTWTATPD